MKLPDIAFLHELADAADQQTLPRFRSSENLAISTKPKEGFRFDPVTLADREAEKAMRDLIAQRYPTHAVMGEEFGLKAGDERAPCWVLDPIDGTRPFLCGLPVWGTLIGLLHHDRAVMGMMSQPFTGERFYADGSQSWVEGPYGKVRLQTRRDVPLDQAILHTTSPESLGQTSLKFDALDKAVLMTRYGGECYAMAMLAAGKIDVCVEFALQPYDIVALIPLIELAGGVVTTPDGGRPEQGGQVIASGCPRLHSQILSILN
ncbi:inositol monophosphatase family protein [Erwinia sp. ACCC 02193]|uniref:Inositol monophosphatase family protein n=1 Tax=Erwinia aeris TaxID=3239803 RepID=A0ABV4E3S1_9GAMM|nr:inositol monophosphatase family protein [Erwinia sp. BC051422]MDN8540440.1 inositol monophosphatase family protein [Erwinia sp. BC051422]